MTIIGEWVIQTACREAASWPADIRVAVNISAVQFRNQDLVKVIANALKEFGLTAERLEVEITESVMLTDPEHVQAVLQALRAMGVGIALDDFGTGYSSLSYLHRFPSTS